MIDNSTIARINASCDRGYDYLDRSPIFHIPHHLLRRRDEARMSDDNFIQIRTNPTAERIVCALPVGERVRLRNETYDARCPACRRVISQCCEEECMLKTLQKEKRNAAKKIKP